MGLTGFGKPAPLIFKLWGLPFVAMGLHFVFGRFLFDAWRRGRTFYGVTGVRIIIVERLITEKVTSIQLQNLPPLQRIMKGDGEGSIMFGKSDPQAMGRRGNSIRFSGAPPCPTFEFIENVREVEQLILSLAAQAARMQGI